MRRRRARARRRLRLELAAWLGLAAAGAALLALRAVAANELDEHEWRALVADGAFG